MDETTEEQGELAREGKPEERGSEPDRADSEVDTLEGRLDMTLEEEGVPSSESAGDLSELP
jgi:hypothetical protein